MGLFLYPLFQLSPLYALMLILLCLNYYSFDVTHYRVRVSLLPFQNMILSIKNSLNFHINLKINLSICIYNSLSLTGAFQVAPWVKNPLAMQEMQETQETQV